MKQSTCALLAALGLWMFLAGSPALAQGPYYRPITSNPYARPPVSPYINLIGRGDLAGRYYGIVRPELQTQSYLGELQRQLAQEQQAIDRGAGSAVLLTGHPVQFLSHSRYFMTLGGGPVRPTSLGLQGQSQFGTVAGTLGYARPYSSTGSIGTRGGYR